MPIASRHSSTAAAIPTVDLQAFLSADEHARERIAGKVDQICRTVGFMVIENHGIDRVTIDGAWQQAAWFFAQTHEQKLLCQAPEPGCPRGYFPLASETLAKSLTTTLSQETPPDLKESFSIGPLTPPLQKAPLEHFDFFYGENYWPEQPAGFAAAWKAYYQAMESLGSNLMQLIAVALNLKPDYFAPLHTHHLSALRALNYPPTSGDHLPGQHGAGAHADYGSVTILKPDPEVQGLEVRLPNGEWHRAPMIADGFIVNIGDMLARWTNDRWVSTLHRVVTTEANKQRQSMAYFMNPNHDAEIRSIPTCLADGQPPRYTPIMAGRYLMDKFSSAL